MACEPFQCTECIEQFHNRCTGHSIHCTACGWSGGNTDINEPCIKCQGPCEKHACQKWPNRGVPVCSIHGGNAPQVKAAAAGRVLEHEARKMLGVEGYDPITDPYSALADLAGEVVKLKDILRGKVEELDTLRSFGGAAAGEQIDVIMQAYERALDRADRILSGMARLDLEDRIARLHTRINSDTVLKILDSMNGALDAANVRGELREVIASEFGTRLRNDSRPGSRKALSATARSALLAADS